jgi:hypothetical protein
MTSQANRTIGVGTEAISSSLSCSTLGSFPFPIFDQKIVDCLAKQNRLRDASLRSQRIQKFRLLGLEIKRLELKPAGRHSF